MDDRQLARFLAIARAAIGVAAVLVPARTGEAWIGPPAHDPRVKVAVRAFGVRDAALGVGLLQALSEGRPAGPWVQAGLVSDSVDAVATAIAVPHLGWRRALPTLAVATGAALIGARLASRVD